MAKEFKWYGLTEEEVKKLDFQRFLELIPSRRRKSLQKMSEAQKNLLKKVAKNDPNLKTHLRDMVIIPAMIGKTIKVYNGKEYFQMLITADMIGHCLGEFAMTRKIVSHSAAGIGATRSSKAISAR